MRFCSTRFLLSSSTRYACLRQLLLARPCRPGPARHVSRAARPLAGGWAGGRLDLPDVVLILMDHSVQEARHAWRRVLPAAGLHQLGAAPHGRLHPPLSRDVLRTRRRSWRQPSSPTSAPRITAADSPPSSAAATWLAHNGVALAETWIASDLQSSNWQPASPRGASASPPSRRPRLLSLSGRTAPNASVTLVSAIHAANPSLNLTFLIECSDPTPATLPLSISSTAHHLDLPVDGPVTRVRPLPSRSHRARFRLRAFSFRLMRQRRRQHALPRPPHRLLLRPDDASRPQPPRRRAFLDGPKLSLRRRRPAPA